MYKNETVSIDNIRKGDNMVSIRKGEKRQNFSAPMFYDKTKIRNMDKRSESYINRL